MSSTPTSPTDAEAANTEASRDEAGGPKRRVRAGAGGSFAGPGAGRAAGRMMAANRRRQLDEAKAAPEVADAEDPTPAVARKRALGPKAAMMAGRGRVNRAEKATVEFTPEMLAEASAAAGPMASPAHIKPRHRLLFLSFLVIILLPVLVSAVYLWGVAKDQYASTVGFSVRREDASAAADILGGLTSLTKSSSSDTDILYEYLRSQKLVADMDARVDLRSVWSKPFGDPVFTFDADGSIEDLVDYWQRMVQTSYDSTTGLIEVRVLAFEPADATEIAQALLDESARMINDLSAAAREDAVRYSRSDLQAAEDRLRTAREAVTAFRVKNQIVDPTTDFQIQAGLVGTLENQLAEAQIEIDLLADAAQNDPRLVQARRRAEVIVARIAAERAKVGAEGGQKDLAALAADYERLLVDREFAEKAYVAALSAYDSAKAESLRTSRYLAAHVLPTTAEMSRYPERLSILGLLVLFLGLIWSIGVLVAYSLKDRR